MKKKAIFTIVACSIAALFLTAILVVGLNTDRFGIDRLKADYENGGAGQSAVQNGTSYEYTWDPEENEITGLKIGWVNRVELKVTDGKLIRITETADRPLDEKERLTLSSSGGVLKVDFQATGRLKIRLSFLDLFRSGAKDLTVELPKKVAEGLGVLTCSTASGSIFSEGLCAEKLEFSTASGDIHLTDFSGVKGTIDTASGKVEVRNAEFSETLSVNAASGAVKCENVKAALADLDTVSGSVAYAGGAEELKVSTVSGEAAAELDACPRESSMDSVSGKLTLVLPENEGFQAIYSSISGKFRTDFPVGSAAGGSSGQVTYGTGRAKLEFNTTSGAMEVRKK